ncbi:hypothetical protein RRG08_012612 [Elysia crispata]|uniref:G-protein coupled receptors family 1 profile domain-containing protein n=1 Tax=Elysia crispata TaxID=231223 RepID=A0AAE1A7W1_9GAST|nr:hypothetical protein RRG08_012612 [Elysia crispata]
MQHLLSVHNPVSPYHYSVDCISRSLNLSLFTQPCRARLSRGIHVVMGAFSFGLFLVRTGCGNRFDSMATESRCCLICPLKKTISPQLSELPISITKGKLITFSPLCTQVNSSPSLPSVPRETHHLLSTLYPGKLITFSPLCTQVNSSPSFPLYTGKLITFLENVVGNASAVTILAISVERHRVAYRTNHNMATNVWATVCKSFLFIWVSSVAGAVPILYIAKYEKDTYVDGTPVGRCMTPIDKTWQKIYLVVSALGFFILPLIVILLLYTKVYIKLLTLFRREQERYLTYPREILRLRRQMTQIIITVVLVFFICHTPYRTIGLWSVFSPRGYPEGMDNESYFAMIYMFRFLLYSNHAINPFVYNFVSRDGAMLVTSALIATTPGFEMNVLIQMTGTY